MGGCYVLKIVNITANRYIDMSTQDMAHASGQEVVVIHVHTDADITGIGFFNLPVFSHGISGDIATILLRRNFKNLLIGENPLLNEKIWRKLIDASFRLGERGIVRNCIAAIDFALWDIKGKLLNVPVSNLLGDNRDDVLTYANVGQQLSPDKLGEKAAGYVDAGHKAVKIRVGSSAVSLPEATERVRTVREAIGPNVKLMVDVNGTWDADTAIEKLKEWSKYDIYWIEEPVPPEDITGYLRVKRFAEQTYVVGGEQNVGLNDFKQFIDMGAIDIAQPNAIATGGITDWLKIYNYATSHSIPVAPWNLQQIHTQLAAGLPNVKWIEYFTTERTNFMGRMIKGSVLEEIKKSDGVYLVPHRTPGLGLELNEEEAEKTLIRD